MADTGLLSPATGVLADVAGHLARQDHAAALAAAEAAMADPAQQRDASGALAAIAFRNRRTANAIQLLELALDENAASSDIPELLAVLNCLVGRLTDALYYAKLATTIPTDHRLIPLFGPQLPAFTHAFRTISPKPLLVRGRALLDEGDVAEATAAIEQHLELFPDDVEALDSYGDALIRSGQARRAVAVLRSVMTLGGPSATLLSRLGNCLTAIGELDQALACHREAVSRAPKATALHAALLRDLACHPHAGGGAQAESVAAWQQAMAETLPATVRRPPPAAVKPRLSVAYLCGGELDSDTRTMISRLARAHDRAAVTVVGFGQGELGDSANVGFRGAFDLWRNISQVDELTLAALLRGEGVDVVVDCDGLAAPGRQGVFARNCAPLQLTWLNLPQAVAIPGASGSLAGAGLSCGPLLLASASGAATGSRDPSAPTFGADVSLRELNAETVRVWSAILNAVPAATLLLADRGLSEPEAVDRLIQSFGNFGVAHRIDIVAAADSEDFFRQVDVALAPFPALRPTPYGIAFSLGRPVVTLAAGEAALLAQALAATGQEGGTMVAADAAHYVAHAVRWAADEAGLERLRAQVPAIRSSAPYQDAAFARGLEDHYRAAIAAKASS